MRGWAVLRLHDAGQSRPEVVAAPGDEAGSELVWSRVLGAGLVARGGDDVWPALTRVV